MTGASLLLWWGVSNVAVAGPTTVPHQGRLIAPSGAVIEGPVDLSFALYATPTGGSATWTESRPAVPLQDGYYAVTLGDVTPLPASVWAADRFLEVSVGGQPTAPRTAIAAVPYSVVAENAVGDLTPRTISVGGTTVIDANGRWTGPAPAVVRGPGLTGNGTASSPLDVGPGFLATSTFNGGFGWSNSKRSFGFNEAAGWQTMTNFDAVTLTTRGNPVLFQVTMQINDDVGIDTGNRPSMACNALVDGAAYRLGQQELYGWYNYEFIYTYATVIPVSAAAHTFHVECAITDQAGRNMNASVGNRGHEDPFGNKSGSNGSYQDVLFVMELGR
jgi:hypothetical protein